MPDILEKIKKKRKKRLLQNQLTIQIINSETKTADDVESSNSAEDFVTDPSLPSLSNSLLPKCVDNKSLSKNELADFENDNKKINLAADKDDVNIIKNLLNNHNCDLVMEGNVEIKRKGHDLTHNSNTEHIFRYTDDLDDWVEKTRHQSDAAMLEDHILFSTPALAGAVKGFGANLQDSLNVTLDSSSHKKLNRNSNWKPSNFDKLYTTGANSYFYGCSQSYVTKPTTVREKRLLASFANHANDVLDSTSTLAIGKNTCNTSCGDHFLSFNDHNLDTPGSENILEDLFFVHSPLPTSILLLCSMLRRTNSRVSCDLDNFQFLDKRRRENMSALFDLSSPLFSNDPKMVPFVHGLRLFHQNQYDLKTSPDCRFDLDYIPALRTIAMLEMIAEKGHAESLKVNNDTSKGTRRSTRQSKRGRRHYFEKLFTGNGCSADIQLECKRIGATLSRMRLNWSTQNET